MMDAANENADNAWRILHQHAGVLFSCWALEMEREEGMQGDEGSRDVVRGGIVKGYSALL